MSGCDRSVRGILSSRRRDDDAAAQSVPDRVDRPGTRGAGALARSYTLPYWQVMRAQMVLMAAEGMRNDQIAARLHCGREVVSQWRKRFFEQRLAGLGGPASARQTVDLSPPQVRAEVIRLACERPADSGVPLSRWSSCELAAEVVDARDRRADLRRSPSGAGCQRTRSNRGSTAPGSSRATRSSAAKAGRILDLYAGRWEGELLASRRLRRLLRREALDPSPSAQAPHNARQARRQAGSASSTSTTGRARCATSRPGTSRRAKLFDRCAPKDGIVPFDKLVEQFMSVEPYSKARRVFVIVDNGSAHRGSEIDRPPPRPVQEPDPRPHPGPRQLGQPGRDLLLDRAAQGAARPTTSPTSTRSSSTSSRSVAATSRSPSRSSGSSPAPTSTVSPRSSIHPADHKPPEPNTWANLRARARR